MKQTLQIRVSQQLTLTPQLQQSIRLLQLSTLELNQELERFLVDNPLLEREEVYGQSAPLNGFQIDGAAQDQTAPVAEAPAADEVRPVEAETPLATYDWSESSSSSHGGRDEGDDGDAPQVCRRESESARASHAAAKLDATVAP